MNFRPCTISHYDPNTVKMDHNDVLVPMYKALNAQHLSDSMLMILVVCCGAWLSWLDAVVEFQDPFFPRHLATGHSQATETKALDVTYQAQNGQFVVPALGVQPCMYVCMHVAK